MTEGGGFGVAAGAVMAMGQAMRHGGGLTGRDTDGPERARLFGALHQIPLGAIQVPITAGAGVYQMNDLLMPKAGFMWSLRRVTASGYTAGSVIVYKGGAIVGGAYTGGGEPFPFAAAATQTLGRGELLLDMGDALIVVCSGITLSAGFAGVQINGAADCFERWLLPEYLGLGQK